MELERGNLVSPTPEAPVIEGDIVTAIRELTNRGWGVKTIARELGIAKTRCGGIDGTRSWPGSRCDPPDG